MEELTRNDWVFQRCPVALRSRVDTMVGTGCRVTIEADRPAWLWLQGKRRGGV